MSRSSAPVELRSEAFEVAVKHYLDTLIEPIGKVMSDGAAPPALREKVRSHLPGIRRHWRMTALRKAFAMP